MKVFTQEQEEMEGSGGLREARPPSLRFPDWKMPLKPKVPLQGPHSLSDVTIRLTGECGPSARPLEALRASLTFVRQQEGASVLSGLKCPSTPPAGSSELSVSLLRGVGRVTPPPKMSSS